MSRRLSPRLCADCKSTAPCSTRPNVVMDERAVWPTRALLLRIQLVARPGPGRRDVSTDVTARETAASVAINRFLSLLCSRNSPAVTRRAGSTRGREGR